MWHLLKQWDRDLFVYLNSLGIERYDGVWIAITQPITWIPLYLLFAFLIFRYFKGRDATRIISFLLLTLGTTVVLGNLTKYFVARLRPSNVPEWADLIRILQTPSNYSFFSGHAATSFAVTTFMVLGFRRFSNWVYLFYIWPVLFALSRIYVGVHYPSDIIVGALVGTGLAIVFYQVGVKTKAKEKG